MPERMVPLSSLIVKQREQRNGKVAGKALSLKEALGRVGVIGELWIKDGEMVAIDDILVLLPEPKDCQNGQVHVSTDDLQRTESLPVA